MAPRKPESRPSGPSARSLRHARIAGTIHPLLPAKIFRPDAAVTDSFLENKRDKRLIRQSAFRSRISAAATASSSKNRVTRRRSAKPSQWSNLDALAGALPDLEAEAARKGTAGDAEPEAGRIRHRSMKTTKGALKRKERIVRGEMYRFGASMAKLSQASTSPLRTKTEECSMEDVREDEAAAQEAPPAAQTTSTANRWAALRGYISSTMEQNPAFANR
ncbi:hypothetical protein RJ55_06392 [Drechmeria coniospora]|nr:hypothetical protein RJ55_06392 [Drechmeria coniospora]